MPESKDIRRHARRPFDCVVMVTWEPRKGETRTARAQGLDVSDSGARFELDQPIEARTVVVLTSKQYGTMGQATVRHCSRRSIKYIIGVEFHQFSHQAEAAPSNDAFVDYYELLQISPNAQTETIQRVYRMLASRYHPDNCETGNAERFMLLKQAYDTLAHPARRMEYDAIYSARKVQPMRVFEQKEFCSGLDAEPNKRLGVLYLLYRRRQTDPEHPGISLIDFERLMSCPREHLSFSLWFLKEKGLLRMEENCDYSICAAGAEFVEQSFAKNRALSNLLLEDGRWATAETERPEPAPAAQRDHTVM